MHTERRHGEHTGRTHLGVYRAVCGWTPLEKLVDRVVVCLIPSRWKTSVQRGVVMVVVLLVGDGGGIDGGEEDGEGEQTSERGCHDGARMGCMGREEATG